NIITKKPTVEREWNTIFNATHKGGSDISTYYSKRTGKLGVTCLVSRSRQRAFDVDKDGFTDIPEFTVTTLNPKIFYFMNAGTLLSFGLTATVDTRRGGDINTLEHNSGFSSGFLEKNKTRRYLSNLEVSRRWLNGDRLVFKNSINRFSRKIYVPDIEFDGRQLSVFNEISFLAKRGSHTFVSGMNLSTDSFIEDSPVRPTEYSLDYSLSTPGIFLQDSWQLTPGVSLNGSIRTDYNNNYGVFLLPHFSVLYNYSDRLSGRFSYGEGYKLPTVFTSEAESMAFKGVRPVSETVVPETSYGMNWDINYKFFMGQFLLTLNPVVYYTKINHYISSRQDSLSEGILIYENTPASVTSRGFETNLKISLDELVLFVDYTYTRIYGIAGKSHRQLDLTPRQKLNLTLTFEEETKWRTGLEAFYTGKQFVSPNDETPDYWTVGIMGQRIFQKFILIGNVENVFDIRQSRYESVVGGTVANPVFKPIWAPLEGVVANIALEITI
ncbi:MAG: TonB-dependent receptor, partial [FCB group bacterium]|nr:TonB-dependent receptor [FCB group bacterium]